MSIRESILEWRWRMNEPQRARSRMNKLERRLGWQFGEGERPKGMHSTTYYKLTEQFRHFDRQELFALYKKFCCSPA